MVALPLQRSMSIITMHNLFMCVFRIARITVQKKYQQRVNQCVSKLIQDKKESLPSDVHSLIAQTLGLQIDASSKLSSW